MNEFNNMILGWKNQPIPGASNNSRAIVELAKKRITGSRNKHIATIAVLGITLFILVLFTIYTGWKSSLFASGIGLMISALGIRIGVEWWSSVQLRKLNIGDFASNYLKQLIHFYQIRKRIHGTFTVVVFGLYVIGFTMLLPLFKESLPNGFFIYIIISGLVVFASLIYFIGKKVNEELGDLSYTINELSSISESFEA